MKDCIFCKIVNDEALSYKVWEDDDHVGFLSIFPNTEGVTVVIPKKHLTSYLFEQSDKDVCALMLATKKVASLLDKSLEDVGRTALVFEGFGVDHLHAKLFPMHGTAGMDEWKAIESKVDKYFEKYEGYISSHDFRQADHSNLEKLADRIRSGND